MQKFGLIGYPLGHSFSPKIHKLIYELIGINASYSLNEIKAQDFKYTLLQNILEDIAGFNVTIPYKTEIMQHLDEINEEAKQIGAVNTIKEVNNKWIGFNTDVDGFLYPLKEYLKNIDTCLVLGTGGAAKAVVYAVLKYIKPQQLIVCGRTLDKAEQLKDTYKEIPKSSDFRVDIIANLNNYFNRAELIVNATSVGMYPNINNSILPDIFSLKEKTIVYDLVYNPLETKLLKQTKENCPDCITFNGLNMLIAQAVKAVEIWTGKPISVEETINALNKSNIFP